MTTEKVESDEGLFELEESLMNFRHMIDSKRLCDYDSDDESGSEQIMGKNMPGPHSLKPYAVNEERRRTTTVETKKIANSIEQDFHKTYWGPICIAFWLAACCATVVSILILDPIKYKISILNAVYPRLYNSNDIPVYFDVYGKNIDFIRKLLFECYGFDEPSKDSLVTDSLCKFQKKFHENKKTPIFALIQNPIISTALAFATKQDPKRPEFNSLVANMSFDEYLNSSLMERNLFIKAIICKSDDNLNEDDLERAKIFLRDESVVTCFQNHEDAFRKYESAFLAKSSPQSKNCTQSKFLEIKDSQQLHIPQILINAYTKELSHINGYDMELYHYALDINNASYW